MNKAVVFDFNLFRAFEVFVAVVETRHMTRAAHMLGMTQSAVSQRLKNLETALGVQLFERGQRPVALTRAGIALHRRATTILGEVDELRSEVRRIESAPLPLLRVAVLPSITTTLTPMLVALVRNTFEIPELSLFAALSIDHHTLLRNRRADLAITSDAFFDIDGLTRYPLITEKFLLITPRGYSGAVNDLAKLAKNLPLVRFSRETQVGMRTDQHLSRVRLELPRAVEGDRASIVMAPVAAGMGFALLTPTLLIDGLAEGMEVDIHKLPIPGFSRELMLVARERELGELPGVFATRCAEMLSQAIDARLPGLPPNTYRTITTSSNAVSSN